MKISVFIILIFLFIVVSSYCGYHEAVGIPQARQLMAIEGLGLRIVGGSQVSAISAYPYQAGIVATLTTGWTSICGGALLSNTSVVTTAHCWWDGESQARQFVVVLGSLTIFSGGTRITTSDVTMHMWNTQEITHDIAMVKITSVGYSNNIQAISLPSIADVNENFSGATAIATGYGKTSDSQTSFPTTTSLHHVNLNIITNTECQKSFTVTLHGSHLCTVGTGGVGTCESDFGGTLTIVRNNQRILGIGEFKTPLELHIQSGTQPIVKPPRRVPLSLMDRLAAKLKSLEVHQIIEKVEHPKSFVSNLVTIEKSDGTLRICLDLKEVNKVLSAT